MNKTLTAAERATIMDACQSISRNADGVKDGCTIDGEWQFSEDKAWYEAEMQLLGRLTALLATQQPEPRAEVKPRKVERHSDMSVLVVFCSTREASVFEKEIRALTRSKP